VRSETRGADCVRVLFLWLMVAPCYLFEAIILDCFEFLGHLLDFFLELELLPYFLFDLFLVLVFDHLLSFV
jgi:hypothetical protein